MRRLRDPRASPAALRAPRESGSRPRRAPSPARRPCMSRKTIACPRPTRLRTGFRRGGRALRRGGGALRASRGGGAGVRRGRGARGGPGARGYLPAGLEEDDVVDEAEAAVQLQRLAKAAAKAAARAAAAALGESRDRLHALAAAWVREPRRGGDSPCPRRGARVCAPPAAAAPAGCEAPALFPSVRHADADAARGSVLRILGLADGADDAAMACCDEVDLLCRPFHGGRRRAARRRLGRRDPRRRARGVPQPRRAHPRGDGKGRGGRARRGAAYEFKAPLSTPHRVEEEAAVAQARGARRPARPRRPGGGGAAG